MKVSIPFKRESGFKVEIEISRDGRIIADGFNSLQTGKWIQSDSLGIDGEVTAQKVSIPFKRESGFKVNASATGAWVKLKFQFPSNGKVDSKPYPGSS